jgi:DNA-binding SARP family transcriptional activator
MGCDLFYEGRQFMQTGLARRRVMRVPGVDVADSSERRQVGVLGGLGVWPADRLSGVGRRVIAYLAVKGPTAQRSLMCMNLWPDQPDDRARANLRRALWQLPEGWIRASSWELRLTADVDLDAATEVAALAMSSVTLDASQISLLTRDLLPGWYDEWLVGEQDLFHLRRIQALEAVCRTAARAQKYGLATMAGLAAICAEPLRESAVLALVEAHLGEGNLFEAVRRYHAYADLLHRELNVEPGDDLAHLISPLIAPNDWTRVGVRTAASAKRSSS